MHTVFSHESYESLIRNFAQKIPALLASHPSTAEFAIAVEKLQLENVLDARFTVAVVGQMRAGKSTLLNAIIERDLAPTGVKETTATINWFRHDAGQYNDIFRVYWQNGDSDDIPLHQVDEWLGQGEKAQKTKFLEFFSNSEFLARAAIVDTPGTRSVIETHENATQSFLAEQLEEMTLAHGGRADAILYVINPVAHERDAQELLNFGGRTRLPGATAYNSLAVMQKWEHLGSGSFLHSDTLAEADIKADRIKRQMEGQISEVIPVSGLLVRCLAKQPVSAWQNIVELAKTPEQALSDLLDSQDFFCDDDPGATLSVAERSHLVKNLPWVILRFAVQCAFREKCTDGAALAAHLHKASGIERLKSLLHQRFFRLSALIKAGSIIRKAWTPCNSAFIRLEQIKKSRDADKRDALNLISKLKSSPQNELVYEVTNYIENSLTALNSDAQLAMQVLRQLDELKAELEHNFSILESDVKCLELLESPDSHSLTQEQHHNLVCLFGGQGSDISQRLACGENTAIGAMITAAEIALDDWSKLRYNMTKKLKPLCDDACERLEQILNVLERE